MITVHNLRTKEEVTYSLPIRDALKAAFLQGKGNFNTWEYDQIDVPIEESKTGIMCGDWFAFKPKPEDRS